MRIEYYPDTDSLFIKLSPGAEAAAEEVAPGIVLHYTPEGALTAIDIDSQASKLVDLSSLAVEGVPLDPDSPSAREIREQEAERTTERMTRIHEQLWRSAVEKLREDRERANREWLK